MLRLLATLLAALEFTSPRLNLHTFVICWPSKVMSLGLCASCVALACAAWVACRKGLKTRHDNAAPTVEGWPLIGNTISLALHGAAFMHWCKVQVHDSTHLYSPQ